MATDHPDGGILKGQQQLLDGSLRGKSVGTLEDDDLTTGIADEEIDRRGFPLLPRWTRSLIRESRVADSRTIATVRSVQPLATTIISSIEAIWVS